MDTQENCAGLAASRYPYLGRAANRGRPAVGGAPVAGGLKLSVVNVPQPQAEAAAGGSALRRRRSNTTRQPSCQLPWGALLLLHPELIDLISPDSFISEAFVVNGGARRRALLLILVRRRRHVQQEQQEGGWLQAAFLGCQLRRQAAPGEKNLDWLMKQ